VNKSKLSPVLICGIIVALFFGISLFLRVGLPYDQIFTADWIKFSSSDAYYHMRLVDNLTHNFPHLTAFDPYIIYPGGASVGTFNFFELLLASIIWIVGLGSPTQHTVDVVGVYFPAVLGALTVIPVYFIGKELFGRWVGVLSAGLIALIPGEFLGRSILGFTDGDILSILLTTVAILFLILALKAARKGQWTFSNLKRRDWAGSAKIFIYSLLVGVFLGMYIYSWQGALLFVFIISAYFVIQFIIDHLKHKSTDYLSFIGVTLFCATLIISIPILSGTLYLASLIIALIIPLVLGIIARLMASKGIKAVFYPLTLIGLALAGVAVLYFTNNTLFNSMLDAFSIFNPAGYTAITTLEMQPILFPKGDFTLFLVWGNFTTSFYLSILSLIILIYSVIKHGNAEKCLLLVWGLTILAATIGQRRFAIYYAVNAALLTSYFVVLIYPVIRFIIDYLRGKKTDYMSWQVLEFTSLEELVAQPAESPTRAERKQVKRLKMKEAKRLQRGQGRTGRERSAGFRPTIIHTSISLWLIVVFFLAFFQNISYARNTASIAPFAPSNAWCSSLSWLKENSPEPFGDPDYYYQYHQVPPGTKIDRLPESAYGVTAWWDYGYWVTRIAHRIPNAHPGQDPEALTRVANFFTSQDETSANKIRGELDASYVVIDDAIALTKFWAVVTWTGGEQAEYFDIYYVEQQNQVVPVQLFHPEYYRSFAIRLYNFDGKAVTPEKSIVISYQEEKSREGILFKLITSAEEFDSYEEAEAYLLSQESGNYKIVSNNPLVSPVPLEEMENYELIYSSNGTSELRTLETVPAIKIFEYTGD